MWIILVLASGLLWPTKMQLPSEQATYLVVPERALKPTKHKHTKTTFSEDTSISFYMLYPYNQTNLLAKQKFVGCLGWVLLASPKEDMRAKVLRIAFELAPYETQSH